MIERGEEGGAMGSNEAVVDVKRRIIEKRVKGVRKAKVKGRVIPKETKKEY